MKIVICGAGLVGAGIASHLAEEHNDVTVIDDSEEKIQRITDQVDVHGVVGTASYPDILSEAGARDAELLIAVTESDEVNMVACQVAHTIFNTPVKIARIRHQPYLDPIYGDLYSPDQLPIDHIISPEAEVSAAVSNQLRVPGAFDVKDMCGGRMNLVGEQNVAKPPACRASPVHRHRDKTRALALDQGNAVSQALLDVVLVLAHQSVRLPGHLEPRGRGEQRGGQDGPCAAHLTVFIMRSHRILASPCCASFCLLNQMNDARPTMWFSGTNPHMRLSAERWRLSPIIQYPSMPKVYVVAGSPSRVTCPSGRSTRSWPS